jgi:hypothetical protein
LIYSRSFEVDHTSSVQNLDDLLIQLRAGSIDPTSAWKQNLDITSLKILITRTYIIYIFFHLIPLLQMTFIFFYLFCSFFIVLDLFLVGGGGVIVTMTFVCNFPYGHTKSTSIMFFLFVIKVVS